VKIATVLNEDDRIMHALTRVLEMAQDDKNQENRVISIK